MSHTAPRLTLFLPKNVLVESFFANFAAKNNKVFNLGD